MSDATEPKFYTITQNNSRGVFDHDPEHGIGYALCVQAYSHEQAQVLAAAIVDRYAQGPYCPCCGERWSTTYFDDEGTEAPELYGEPLKGGWGLPSYVHYLDGRIEEVGAEQSSPSHGRAVQ